MYAYLLQKRWSARTKTLNFIQVLVFRKIYHQNKHFVLFIRYQIYLTYIHNIHILYKSQYHRRKAHMGKHCPEMRGIVE